MTSPIRVAIVGLGIGAAHADGFRRLPEQFEVVVAADLDAERVAFVTDWLGCEGAVTLDDVLGRDDIDVVSLATPPWLHRDHIEQCLRAGVDVICEKPLVGSLAEVDELAAIEADTGHLVMPVFQYRYGRGLQKLEHLVDHGVTGRLHTANVEVSWRRRPEYYDVAWRGKWATEMGGVLLSHCIHALDMVTYVAGPVARAFARTATRVNAIETEDTASVSLELADGGFATLSATLGSAVEVSRHRFCFEHVMAESNTEAYENHREPWTFAGDTERDDEAIAAAFDTFEPRAELYKGQFQRFVEARAAGTALPVTLDDARASLELITALYFSAHTHTDVELPLGTDHPFYRGWR
jgi:predicted dehydrogenase